MKNEVLIGWLPVVVREGVVGSMILIEVSVLMLGASGMGS